MKSSNSKTKKSSHKTSSYSSPNERIIDMFMMFMVNLASVTEGIANATLRCYDNKQYPYCINDSDILIGGTDAADLAISERIVAFQEKFVKATKVIFEKFLDPAFGVAKDAIYGDLADQSLSEAMPQLISLLKTNEAFLTSMASNPDVQNAIKDISEAYAVLGIQGISSVTPSINLIVDQFWQTASDVSKKSIVGSVYFASSLVKASISEIPVAGGFINLAWAILDGFTLGLKTIAPIAKNATTNTVLAYDAAKNLKNTTQKAAGKVRKATNDFKRIANMKITPPNTHPSLSKQIKSNIDTATKVGAKIGKQFKDNFKTISKAANDGQLPELAGKSAANAYTPIKKNLNRTENSFNQTLNQNISQSGGFYLNTRKLRRKIYTINKRINKNIKSFNSATRKKK